MLKFYLSRNIKIDKKLNCIIIKTVKPKFIYLFYFLVSMNCISLESLLEKFSEQQLINKQEKRNYNEEEKQKEQKENLKKAYNTKRRIEEQKEKECFELNKHYILQDSTTKILNCN